MGQLAAEGQRLLLFPACRRSPIFGRSARILLPLPLALTTQHENPANTGTVQELQVQRGAMRVQELLTHVGK